MLSNMKVTLLFFALTGLSTQNDCYFTQTSFAEPAAQDGIVIVDTCAAAQCCMDEHCIGMIMLNKDDANGKCIFGTPPLTATAGSKPGTLYLKEAKNVATCPAPGDFEKHQEEIKTAMGSITCKDILNGS